MPNDLQELLDTAKDLLKNELTEIAFNTWIVPLNIESRMGNEIVLSVENEFFRDTIMSKHLPLIRNTFNFITKLDCNVSIIVQGNTPPVIEPDFTPQPFAFTQNREAQKTVTQNCLNPKYTFESYVVGNNNRFAHAAALAVAESPATLYNPLFLYGGVGLGKTHLMHAIGNEIFKRNPNLNVLYVTSEKFTNDFINGLQEKKIDSFRNKYRNIDVLLIDDIQFIAGKDNSQEEFFHTFNSLHENIKQIVMSSDKPPKDLNFDERLKSRFEWGLLVDISKPDYETRLAILRNKIQQEKLLIDDNILVNIATKVDSNIRELEGIIKKLMVTASLTKGPITVELAEKAVNDMISEKEKIISSDYIQDVVAKYFNLEVKDLKSSKRSNDIAYPRQIAMFLCRDIANMPFIKIGQSFGKRDHTTVMHACNKIENELKENNNTKLIVESVKKIILSQE